MCRYRRGYWHVTRVCSGYRGLCEERAHEEEKHLHSPTSSSPRAMSTSAATRVPEELFPFIIQHLPIEFRYGRQFLPNDEIRDSGVVVGSLVCMYWAEKCREMLFRGRTVEIESMKSAVGLRNLVVGAGCKRLTRLADMIGYVDVVHDLKRDGRSLYQILGAVIPPSKFREFRVCGPRSALHAGLRLRTPYWGVGRPLPQFVTPYRRLELYKLHFASISDVICFVDQFPHIEELVLWQLTWDETGVDAPNMPNVIPPPDTRHRSLRSIQLGRCADNLILWRLVALGSKPRTPLQLLSPVDRRAVLDLVTSACGVSKEIERNNEMNYELTESGENSTNLT